MRTFVDPGARFVPLCAERFAFLEREYACSRSVVENGRAVLYRNRATGVKIELHPRDDDVWISLVRLVNGALPPLFAYAPSHWLDLDRLLAARAPATALARRAPGERFTAEYLERALEERARVLRRYASDVLSGDHAVFEEVPA